ncbi:C45 family peptidase [Salinibacillus xinjiangensis]|nr:C45 family peptidase [Salinibacillus xinjiangensis]
MDQNFQVDILQLRNNPYEIGVRLGEWVKDKPIFQSFKSITKTEIDHTSMKHILQTYTPHLVEEIQGLADGVGVSFQKAAALFSGYDVPKVDAMGCTAFVNQHFYVRNYDFSPELYDGIFTLVQPNQSNAIAGYNLQLLGRHDGVNEQGLVGGIHFVSNVDYRKGFSAWTSLRMVLDVCSTVDDAYHLLKELPHAACYNFSLADQHGNMAVVEASPEQVNKRSHPSSMYCVNRFQTKPMEDKNRSNIEGSLKRESFLETIKSESHEELFNLFRNIDSPLFFTDYEELFGTIHTFSYSFHNSRILTTIAQGHEPLDIDFRKWLNGHDVKEDTMKGMI